MDILKLSCFCVQEEEEIYREDPETRPSAPEAQVAPTQPPRYRPSRNREHFATIRTASLVSQSQKMCAEMLLCSIHN